MALPSYAGPGEIAWYYGYRVFCGLVFLFLIVPILVIIPLSFNSVPFFTFTPEMLSFDPAGYSLRWYKDFLNNPQWIHSLQNSFIIAFVSTIFSTVLGTLAALGLSKPYTPYKAAIMGALISPMIVPLIISATGMFFFYTKVGLAQTHLGIILAHTALGTPFVVITVTATLVGFDQSLVRAAQNLGASPPTVFFKVIMPLILPGVISGGRFAFITPFDEVVVILFLGSAGEQTLPWRMFTGLREQISPTILAVATLLVSVSVVLLVTLEILRRRSERLRGMSPG